MRRAHELGLGTSRQAHNLERATPSNLLHGEMGLTWVGQKKDVKMFISNCGICLRFRKKHCRPPLGKSLYRVKIDPKPFTHLSVDPLGVIRVKGVGTQTQRLYPIIMACPNSGGVHTEIMSGLEARDVYLALLRLQYR